MTDQQISVKDAANTAQPVAVTATLNEQGETVFVQQVIVVDPDTRDPIEFATKADITALTNAVVEQNLLLQYPNFILDSTTTAGVVYFYQTDTEGAAETDANWKIGRYTKATNTKEWADGDTNFDNVASLRASLTYA